MLDPMFAAVTLLLWFAAPEGTDAPRTGAPDWQQTAQRMQSFVIHVPRMTITRTTIVTRSMPAPPPPPPPLMVEKKADDCVKMENIRGFSVSGADSVDLMLKSGKLLRAKLGKDCPALGFYSGFYVKANPDRKMCIGRDSIRSRSGRLCSLQEFRSLVPAK